jgi:hypothetical protein
MDVAEYCNIGRPDPTTIYFLAPLRYGIAAIRHFVVAIKNFGGSGMKRTLALLVLLGLFAAVAPVRAHHSTAMYSGSKTVTGKVLKFEWTNPHAHIYIETKDEKGNTVVWDCEMMSLNHLRSYGWTSKTVQVGDTISATGAFAKSGDPAMIASRMKLADGREISS